jgi:hypothetical protein
LQYFLRFGQRTVQATLYVVYPVSSWAFAEWLPYREHLLRSVPGYRLPAAAAALLPSGLRGDMSLTLAGSTDIAVYVAGWLA